MKINNKTTLKKTITQSMTVMLTLAALTLIVVIMVLNSPGPKRPKAETSAAPADIVVNLKNESGVAKRNTLEVGQTVIKKVANLNTALSGDLNYVDVSYTTDGNDGGNLYIKGVSAASGVTVAYGGKKGRMTVEEYLVVDPDNISAYKIQDGGVIQFNAIGDSKPIPVKIIKGTDSIVWRSTNEEVAVVYRAASGNDGGADPGKAVGDLGGGVLGGVPYGDANQGVSMVAAKEKGLAYIIGEFTDKWGVKREICILACVGINLGDGVLYKESMFGGQIGGGNYTHYDIPPERLSDAAFAAMIEEGEKYLGYPYVWGGSSPSTSFDCSGFVSWVVNHSGWSIGRNGSQSLFDKSTPVSNEDARPGDLVFFEGTYDSPGITHVGIYVGDGMMLHCGDPIGYSSINTIFWQQHFVGFGRLPSLQ
jgi:hypothetical protein